MLLHLRAFIAKFIGTQLFDVDASSNEDHKVWRPLWFHQLALYLELLFIYNTKNTSLFLKNFVISCRYSSSNKQQNIFVQALPSSACPFYGRHVVWVEGLSDASAPQRLFYSNVEQELLLGEIDKATAWWVVQGCFKLYVGETLAEKSDLFGLRTCRCGVWIVISAYVGKHNYLLSWTIDAWLRQPKLVFGNTLRASNFLQALWVSIAETLSTFTISPKGLPDGWCELEWVESILV